MALFNRFTLSLYALLHCFNSVDPQCVCTCTNSTSSTTNSPVDECKEVEDTPYEVVLSSKYGQTATSEMKQLIVGTKTDIFPDGGHHDRLFYTICVDVKFDGHGSVPKTTIRIPTNTRSEAELYFSYANNNILTVGYHTLSTVHSVNIKNGTYHTICVDVQHKIAHYYVGLILTNIITFVDGKDVRAWKGRSTWSSETNNVKNLKLAIDKNKNTDVHVHLANLRFYNSTTQKENIQVRRETANDTVCNELSGEMLKWNEPRRWCMTGKFNIVKHPCEKRCPNCN